MSSRDDGRRPRDGDPECATCGGAHAAPEAWLAPLRAGDHRLALEALTAQWLGELSLPPIEHRNLATVLDRLGPRLEPVLVMNHLRPPQPAAHREWCFGWENQGCWDIFVDDADHVTLRTRAGTYGGQYHPEVRSRYGTLGEFLLAFTLHELSCGLPAGASLELHVTALEAAPALPRCPLPPWVRPGGEGDPMHFHAAPGVVCSAATQEGWAFLILGGRCKRAVADVVRALRDASARAGALLDTRQVDRRRRPPVSTTPWHQR